MGTVIELEDGRIFPCYNGEALAWSVELYNTPSESAIGYPRLKAVVDAMQEHRPLQLDIFRRELSFDCFGKMFGRNAKRLQDVIDAHLGNHIYDDKK